MVSKIKFTFFPVQLYLDTFIVTMLFDICALIRAKRGIVTSKDCESEIIGGKCRFFVINHIDNVFSDLLFQK